jgi:N utilization substance protein B
MQLRRAARLAAIQALYQMDVAQTPSKTVVFEFQNLRFGHEDEPGYVQADEPFFEALVSGVVDSQKEIDPLISDRLSEKWRLSRLDRTLRAILRCATYEMAKRPDVPAKTIIDQYVGLSMDFFEARESGFVNAVLDKMGRDLRADEMSAKSS